MDSQNNLAENGSGSKEINSEEELAYFAKNDAAWKVHSKAQEAMSKAEITATISEEHYSLMRKQATVSTANFGAGSDVPKPSQEAQRAAKKNWLAMDNESITAQKTAAVAFKDMQALWKEAKDGQRAKSFPMWSVTLSGLFAIRCRLHYLVLQQFDHIPVSPQLLLTMCILIAGPNDILKDAKPDLCAAWEARGYCNWVNFVEAQCQMACLEGPRKRARDSRTKLKLLKAAGSNDEAKTSAKTAVKTAEDRVASDKMTLESALRAANYAVTDDPLKKATAERRVKNAADIAMADMKIVARRKAEERMEKDEARVVAKRLADAKAKAKEFATSAVRAEKEEASHSAAAQKVLASTAEEVKSMEGKESSVFEAAAIDVADRLKAIEKMEAETKFNTVLPEDELTQVFIEHRQITARERTLKRFIRDDEEKSQRRVNELTEKAGLGLRDPKSQDHTRNVIKGSSEKPTIDIS